MRVWAPFFARKARTARFGADVRKRGIDRDEQKARDEAREDRFADNARVLRDAERADVHRDDEAEVEGRERVHRLIALDEAADERRRVIGARTAPYSPSGCTMAAMKSTAMSVSSVGGKDLAEALRELFGVECDREGEQEEEDGVGGLGDGMGLEAHDGAESALTCEEWRNRHLEGRCPPYGEWRGRDRSRGRSEA